MAGHSPRERRICASSDNDETPCTASPRTKEASRASHRGTTSSSGAVASARAITPGTWRNEPLSPSSPQKASDAVHSGGS
jgi:hypothetical protein